jgi:hypothetical protein
MIKMRMFSAFYRFGISRVRPAGFGAVYAKKQLELDPMTIADI